jgi:iron complex transport system ATP-binding protein
VSAGKATPLLRARDVAVRLGGRTVVDGAALDLDAGALTAMVGPNGAGKTTLIRACAGLLPAEGSIALGGRALASLAPRERARMVGYLPQGHVFYWPIAVAAVVALGRYPHADPFSPLSAGDRDAVERALDACSLNDLAARPVSTLSEGERARVALARVLASEAPIILADEPTAALDPRHQLVVMELLRQTARKGSAVLAVVHDLTLAARFADRVLVMDRGRIVADAPAAEALNRGLIAEIFGVDATIIDSGAGPIPLPQRAI